jgi:hypothetical protein
MRAWLAALIFVAGISPSEAKYWAVGQGRSSCASWLSHPEFERDGDQWIVGYWTAMNKYNKQNSEVGSRSDPEGILGEIKKICLAEPSSVLDDVVGRVYKRFEEEGK